MRIDFIEKIKKLRDDKIDSYMNSGDSKLLTDIYKINFILMSEAQYTQAEFAKSFAQEMSEKTKDLDFSTLDVQGLFDNILKK